MVAFWGKIVGNNDKNTIDKILTKTGLQITQATVEHIEICSRDFVRSTSGVVIPGDVRFESIAILVDFLKEILVSLGRWKEDRDVGADVGQGLEIEEIGDDLYATP
jgi:hypothetical protein